MTKKRCIDCGSSKPLDAFYKMHKEGPDGPRARQSRCKPCDNAKRAGNFKRCLSDHHVVVTRAARGTPH